MTHNPLSHTYRLWDTGQRHLASGRYVAAQTLLEAAETAAWRARDARTLARLYLPLLETRRQIRYQAAEGEIVLIRSTGERSSLDRFLKAPAGTLLIAMRDLPAALTLARRVQWTRHRTGRWLEALLLIEQHPHLRITSAADATFAAGLPIVWTNDPRAAIAASTDPHLTVPLPPLRSGEERYAPGPARAVARESLLIAWEALALRWQHRHPLTIKSPWAELAWLRRALLIDPACEPVAMRLIALAEAIERTGQH
jgi:hypothetical protein